MSLLEKKKLELLAPAGTVEVFETAVRAGADAVYIGAPSLNARFLARHFSMAEIAAMIDYAHGRRVKVYVAMNSLMKEEEIPQAAETLAMLDRLRVDAVILQDLGVYHLARTYFPDLRLHASTLMGAHNSLNARQFERMGFSRVVLAREMTLAEISACRKETDVELEVFVHGAMCFSYSGLCLFSSYLGGKSGLRGRCVQPCRRRYEWQGKGKGHRAGYFFTMSDLSSIELIGQLQAAGISSLKIEGRMRSASYVESVIRAYRTVLDARPGDAEALRSANDLLERAMGRSTTRGYFLGGQPAGIIQPQHSGNIGLFLGKIERAKGRRISLALKESLFKGDRLRLHLEASGERHSFTVAELLQKGRKNDRAAAGESVEIETPVEARPGDTLYKVDVAERREQSAQEIKPARFAGLVKKISTDKRLRQFIASLESPSARSEGPRSSRKPDARKPEARGKGGSLPSRKVQLPLELWLRIDDLRVLKFSLPWLPERLVVTLTGETYSQIGRMGKFLAPHQRRLIWSLPPVILENDLEFYRRAAKDLLAKGFLDWQVSHIGQVLLFEGLDRGRGEKIAAREKTGEKARRERIAPGRLRLYGDYTLNILNSSALQTLKNFNIHAAQLSLEGDRDTLRRTCQAQVPFKHGLTVYGLPPLFTARLAPDFFQFERPFVSPKGETFILKQRWGQTVAVGLQPFSLVPFLADLAEGGVDYAVVDLSNMQLRQGDLADILNQPARGKAKRLSSFNYQGKLS